MNNALENKKFWLAAFLCVAGVALLFVSLLTNGEIANGVLAGTGELLITGGAILGIDVVYGNKLKEIANQFREEVKEDARKEASRE